MKDFLDSISEYAKTRLTNPFFGTIIAVWIIRNFEFLFSLFNFDKGVVRLQKIAYIRSYFKTHGTWSEFWTTLGIAFSVLVFSFLVLLITRALTNGYTASLNYLNAKTAKSTMVEYEKYASLLNVVTDLKKEKDILKGDVSGHDAELIRLNNEKINLDNQRLELQDRLNTAHNELNFLLNGKSEEKKKSQEIEEKLKYTWKKINELLDKNNLHILSQFDFKVTSSNRLKSYSETYRLNSPSIAAKIREVLDEKVLETVDNDLQRDFIILAFILNSPVNNPTFNFYELGPIRNSYNITLLSKAAKVDNATIKAIFQQIDSRQDLKYFQISELGFHVYNVLREYFIKEENLTLETVDSSTNTEFV